MKGALILVHGKISNTLYLISGSNDMHENTMLQNSKFACAKWMMKQKSVNLVVPHLSLDKSLEMVEWRRSVTDRNRVPGIQRKSTPIVACGFVKTKRPP